MYTSIYVKNVETCMIIRKQKDNFQRLLVTVEK